MSSPQSTEAPKRSVASIIVFWLSVAFVVVGMINAMPGIPGLDAWATRVTGNSSFLIRKFPFEYYYPLAFAVMMLIVAVELAATSTWYVHDSSAGQMPEVDVNVSAVPATPDVYSDMIDLAMICAFDWSLATTAA